MAATTAAPRMADSPGTPQSRERRRTALAGGFALGVLLLGGLMVFILGREEQLFTRHVEYRMWFPSVEGLSTDSPVRLGGLNVGRVVNIAFPEDLSDTRVFVEVEVAKEYAQRVRQDSVARIGSRGVLGDKVVDITMGSGGTQALPENGIIETAPGVDISTVLRSAGEVMDNVVAVSHDVREAIAAYTQPELREDLGATVRSVRRVVERVEKGPGALHALLYDPRGAQSAQALLANGAQAAGRFGAAAEELERILREVRQGDGTAHALLYGNEGKQAVASLGKAANELAGLLESARTDERSPGMMRDLGATAGHLRSIAAKVDEGDGSLGALINDPTVYEDLKTVLGNVKRNHLLRTLIRWNLSRGDALKNVGAPLQESAR